MRTNCLFPALVAAGAVVVSAGAAEICYVGSPTNASWNVGSNWEGGVAPGKDDIGVFDLGSGVTTNVTLSNQTKIGGVKVLSGSLYLGTRNDWEIRFAGDANGDAFVHVAGDASILFSNKLYSASNGKVRLRKTGAGPLKTVATIGNRSYYFSVLDIEAGTVQGAAGKNGLMRQTNTIVRAGATLNFNQYSFTAGSQDGVGVTVEEGATFIISSESMDGINGNGLIQGTMNWGTSMSLGYHGPYRFGGTVARKSGNQAFVFTYGAQGTFPDEKYGFILTSANALNDVGRNTLNAGGINPLKFAPGIGWFNIYQLDSKKGAPLILEDTNGDPVTVSICCLSIPGSPDGSAKDPSRFPYFGVEGCGNFNLSASGAWRSESLAFTNDCFRNTGWIGATGVMKLGDQTEGHDAGLTHVAGVRSFSGGTVYYRNFSDLVQTGYVQNAGTVSFDGPGAVTIRGAASGAGTFAIKTPTVLENFVSGEDSISAFNISTNFALDARGGEAWVRRFDHSVSGKTQTLSNGVFHGAYVTDTYTSTGLRIPGPITFNPTKVSVRNADAWVLGGDNSLTTGYTVGPGGRLFVYNTLSPSSGTITLDGGESGPYLIQSFGHDTFPRSSGWTIKVTERGGRLADYTWRARGGSYVRPYLNGAAVSGAAADGTPGELALSFHNQLTINATLATGGRILLDSGEFLLGSASACLSAYKDGSFFGTGDLAFGSMCLYIGDKASDYDLHLVADGQKLRLEGGAMIVGRDYYKSGNTWYESTPQTVTFGDGVSNPFARAKGGGALILYDAKTGQYSLDGTGPKFYVAGAKAELDPETHILTDPVVGAAYAEGAGYFYRMGFLTQDADGLLREDLSLYTEGVEGGAKTVARLSVAGTNLTTDAQVAALNLDGRPLTIAKGATLKVGPDATDRPAVVLMRVTDGWSVNVRYGSIYGAGTLDFGASEGLIVAGPGTREYGSASIGATVAGTGGLTLLGATPQYASGSKVSLSGANTYTGGTRIDGTTVVLNSAGALSTGPVSVGRGEYNGGRVRFKTAGATYANEWTVSGVGAYLYAEAGFEPGCLNFLAETTLTGPVRVVRSARFSTSPAENSCVMQYGALGNASGTGVFAGEISGGAVEIIAATPNGYAKKPIVFAHANSYTGGTFIVNQDLVLRGDGDCGTGPVKLGSGGTFAFENTAEKTFPNVLEGKGTVKLAGSAPVHFTGTVKKESWCNLKLDLAGTSPVFTEAPPFANVTNSSAKLVNVTLKGDMTLDPADYAYLESNVRVRLDGGAVDLAGGTITVERAVRRNGGRFTNGTVNETNPAKGTMVILK